MFENAFVGVDKAPTADEVKKALGHQVMLWKELLADLSSEWHISGEWHSYSRKAGWSLRLKQKDRTILYLSPGRTEFRASFALGDAAVREAQKSELSASVKKTIKSAKRYAEGTAVRIEVHTPGDIETVKMLVRIKLEN